jgi:hypothetical protein
MVPFPVIDCFSGYIVRNLIRCDYRYIDALDLRWFAKNLGS